MSEAVKAFKRLLSSKSIRFKINVGKKKHVKKRKVVLPRKPLNVELLGIEDVGLVFRLKIYSRRGVLKMKIFLF